MGVLVIIVAEQCRSLDAPFLNLVCDLMDDGVVTVEEMQDKIVSFVEVSELARYAVTF